MTLTGFIIKNALRNKRRFLLSVLSAAISLFLLVMLLVILRELTSPPTSGDASLRVAARSKISLAASLPQRQRAAIERIPGVEVCTPFVWFGGKFKEDEQLPFGQLAVEPEKLRFLLTEMEFDEAEYDAWVKERTGCLVGRDTMKALGKKIGDKLILTSGLYPCKVELKIIGTYWGTVDDRNVFFSHAYFDEAMNQWGRTGMWWIKLTSADAAVTTCAAIEAEFANSSDEVRAETERAFQMSFVAMWGNIKFLIGGICTLVVITLMLVTGSTMSMAIRERFRELAILKAIGFKRRDIFAFILAESFGLAMLGAIIGAGGAWLLTINLPLDKIAGGIFVSFEATQQIMGTAFLIACALGISSCIFPALAVTRMSVVQGLKTLD